MKRFALACTVLAVSAASAAQAGDSGSISGRVLVNPLSVEVTRPDEPLRRGRWFRVVALVANGGATRLDAVGVTLVRPPALLLQGQATQTIPRIPARASRRVHWEVCSNTPGGYVVLARAHVGPFTAESLGALVQILPSNRTC
jgi:hypothetical protein